MLNMHTPTEEKHEQAAPSEEQLRNAGFTVAATKLAQAKELARKLRVAFEHFRVVEPTHIKRFNQKLNQAGFMRGVTTYLAFTPIELYGEIPPVAALEALEKARELKCFDRFEVATIAEVPDPIIFGCINRSDNKYFVTQWDDDVKIEDILTEDEG
jgi:hypothetical protein